MTTPQTFRLTLDEYLPDQVAIDLNALQEGKNVLPIATGYKPFKGLTVYSDALVARAQGAFSLQDNSGNALNFAGDATQLYKLGSASWTNVSRVSGGNYNTAEDAGWYFTKFKDLVIGVNGADSPQKWDITSSSNFAALGGSPPTAKYVATVRDQVALGGLSTDPNAVAISAFNNAESWTAGANQSILQSFPEGGWVRNVIGGEVLYVFQERAIQRGTYTGGTLVYQFDEVERNVGLFTGGAVTRHGRRIFFLDYDDIYVLDAVTGGVRAIGAQKVAKTFFADLNETYIDRIKSAVDPINKLALWAVPSAQSVSGVLDKLWAYNWELDRWAPPIEVDTQLIYTARQEGTDLDSLDAIYPSGIDSIPFSLDSRVFAGGALELSAFNIDNKLAYFTGDNLEAVVCAKERQIIPGQRVRITNTTPITDTSDVTVAIGTRERRADNISYTDEVSVQSNGACPVLASGRYACGRMTWPAGTVWTEVQAIDVDASPMGKR